MSRICMKGTFILDFVKVFEHSSDMRWIRKKEENSEPPFGYDNTLLALDDISYGGCAINRWLLVMDAYLLHTPRP